MVIQKYSKTNVRPKNHYDLALTIKDVINYIKRKGASFVDLDEFLLYFSASPFAFYPL